MANVKYEELTADEQQRAAAARRRDLELEHVRLRFENIGAPDGAGPAARLAEVEAGLAQIDEEQKTLASE